MTLDNYTTANQIRAKITHYDALRLRLLKGENIIIGMLDESKDSKLRKALISFFESEAEMLEQEFQKL